MLIAAERSEVSAPGRVTGRALASAWWLLAAIVAGYVAGAELSWHSFSSGAAFGFPPAGITLAALLLTARRRWPLVIAAIVIGEVAVDLQHHVPLLVVLGSAAANAVEPVVGATCAAWFCHGRPDLTVRADLLEVRRRSRRARAAGRRPDRRELQRGHADGR